MTPAPMPELPEAAFVRVIPPAHYKDTETTVPLYTAAQMRAYARAYAAGMAGDGARLDWLARMFEHGSITATHYGPGTAGCQLFTVPTQHTKGPTLRAAIDAAMKDSP